MLGLALTLAAGAASTHAPDPMVDGHAHADPQLHRFDFGGVTLVGHVNPLKARRASGDGAGDWSAKLGFEPVAGGAADASGAYFGEVDVRGNLAFLAQLKPPAGVHVIDVSDPASPREVGRWIVPDGSGGITDVKASFDGTHVYAAYQGSFGDPSNGVFVLDVSDPTNPRQVSHWSVENTGVHMLFVWQALEREWVIAPTATGGGGAPIALAGAHPVSGTRTLTPVSKWGTGESPHDVWVYDDPTLGVPIMVVANGLNGIALVALASPATPVTLGTWDYEGAPLFYAHTVRASVADGKRYVVVSPEGGASGVGTTEVAKLWVLDATVVAKPTLASSWGNPGGHVANTFLHSTHNFQLVNGKVYLAHNHAGAWVLDFTAPPAIHEIGYYLPAAHDTTSTPGGSLIQDAIPATWDVTVKEGLIYAGDRAGGLYVLHHADDAVGPGGPTSYG